MSAMESGGHGHESSDHKSRSSKWLEGARKPMRALGMGAVIYAVASIALTVSGIIVPLYVAGFLGAGSAALSLTDKPDGSKKGGHGAH